MTDAPTLGTSHAQHIELAGEITENDGTVAGHIQRERWPNRYIKPTATTAPIIAKSAAFRG